MKEHTRLRYHEIYPRIYRIILPLPGDKPGPVNAYIFTGKTVTLLDTGTLKTVHILEHALAQIGISFSDIDQIILTHGHIDHYGAARKISGAPSGRSRRLPIITRPPASYGAFLPRLKPGDSKPRGIEGSRGLVTVAAHEEDKSLIEHGMEVPRKQFIKYYQLMGVPLIFQVSFVLIRWFFSYMAENCRIDRLLSDGEKILMGDYEATVIATPGHTRGSISLYLEKEGILFPGDHILGHITPNALVTLEADFDLPQRMSQVEFYDSLQKIEEISPRIVYPAHGEPIQNVGSTIAMFREQFSLRQKDILSILTRGEYTVYQIGRKLFPDISGKRLPLEIFLMVSEVYTHLQLLQKEDKVASYLNKGALYYKINK